MNAIRARWAVVGALTGVILWAYWPTLWEMQQRWSADPQYSHGWLVPLFAVALLWVRRPAPALAATAINWAGAGLVGVSLLARFAGAYFHLGWLDGVSLIPLLTGLVLLIGGRALLRWAAPSILFLFFMIPLPYRVEMALAYPLRRFATICSTYLLQTVGLPAIAQGNVIHIDTARIGVVEACSGLSMLMVFAALSVAVVLLIDRAWWEKGLILLSAVPIALIANVTRITVTGILHVTTSSETANIFFHDFAGWLMMPFALLLVWAELTYLGWVAVRAGGAADAAVTVAGQPGV